jgi:hypothetical protein
VPGEFVAVRAPTVGAVDDVTIRAAFRKVGGPPGGGYGLIVRDDRSGAGDGLDQVGRFVVAGVGDRGDFGIWQREIDHWVDLVPWTASPSVRPGSALNTLQVSAEGRQLRFEVNGMQVADIAVPSATGRVGVFVGGDLNQVRLDRMVVQRLPTARQPDQASTQWQVSPGGASIVKSAARAPANADGLEWQRQMSTWLSSVKRLERDFSTNYSTAVARGDRRQRVVALLNDLRQDVTFVLESLSDGFDSPRSPVYNREILAADAQHLQSAVRNAQQIRQELDDLTAGMGMDGQ